jgi:cytochrome bd ubiquinol oxidase subunit I
MNQPQGYTLDSAGKVTDVDPLKVIFNPAVPYEVPHMIFAAYIVTGFLIASVYAVGMLRGRRDRHHRLGMLIPLTIAAIATPIQFGIGDTAARAIADDQPIKFAAMECVQETSTNVTEYLGGRCTSDGVKGGIGIPGLDSFLVGWSTSTEVTGLDSVPPDDRPPANTLLHWSFDAMVGICTLLMGLGLWLGISWLRRRDGRGGGRGARMRLDRDRGRPPALGRLRGDADQGRRHRRQRRLDHVRRRDPPIYGARRRDGDRAARDGPALAHRGDRR